LAKAEEPHTRVDSEAPRLRPETGLTVTPSGDQKNGRRARPEDARGRLQQILVPFDGVEAPHGGDHPLLVGDPQVGPEARLDLLRYRPRRPYPVVDDSDTTRRRAGPLHHEALDLFRHHDHRRSAADRPGRQPPAAQTDVV